jgi:selenocysteine-specific elongation factor
MPLIGTAGHVDHGKSTLVQALTGRDPDRWEEEKRRGLTIDLGFAWAVLPGNIEVSFVDVPGHQRFAKNLLAGIEAIDLALLVVAADDGWMPQTEEHLAVVTLLEVPQILIAITKADLVDESQLELAAAEIAERVAGTSLSASPVIPVSAVTGEGLNRLSVELGRLAGMARPRDIGRPRLWVDRAFTPAGAGLVVTGTLLDGSLAIGAEVTVYPSGARARVRAIQTHEQMADLVEPGRRVALNLAGVSRLARGDMVGLEGQWRLSSRFTASVKRARYVEELDQRGAYHLHVGSLACPVSIHGLDGDMMLLRTGSAVPLAAGDRFVIRDTGRRLVVAGGRVLDPQPGSAKRALEDSLGIDPESSADEMAAALLEIRETDSVANLAMDSGGGSPHRGELVGDTWLAPGRIETLCEETVALVEDFHSLHPLRDGAPLSTIASQLGVAIDVATRVVDTSVALERTGSVVAARGRLTPTAGDSRRVIERLSEGLAVPTVSELDTDPELIHLMVRRGDLVRISPELVFLPEQIEHLGKVIRALRGGFTIADFREETGLSRKYAIPILEWADREGLTARRGEGRWPL